jgi:transmembrane sensor
MVKRGIVSLMLDPNATKEAIDWVIRLRDPATTDWVGFTDWLEKSPDNAGAYDAIALVDADMAEVANKMARPENMQAANDNIGRYRRYAGIAAALFIAVIAYPLYNAFTPTYSIETALGEQRDVALDDGSLVELNGGTRLTLDKRNARLVSLDYGEAQFTVKHDSSKPFTVKTGGSIIQDIGTVFNVRRENTETELAVSEGSVLFNPGNQAVLLKKGQTLFTHDGNAKPALSTVDPDFIGGWKTGRLSYKGVPLAKVASDLSRFIGKRVSVAPDLAGRSFTGTIVVGGKDAIALNRISALMGVRATPTDNGWQLTAL